MNKTHFRNYTQFHETGVCMCTRIPYNGKIWQMSHLNVIIIWRLRRGYYSTDVASTGTLVWRSTVKFAKSSCYTVLTVDNSLHFSGDVMDCGLWLQFPRVDTQVHHVTTSPVVAHFECVRIQILQRFRPERGGINYEKQRMPG